MVTHSSTSRPVQCLCMAERTGCPVLTDLWSYVRLFMLFYFMLTFKKKAADHIYPNRCRFTASSKFADKYMLRNAHVSAQHRDMICTLPWFGPNLHFTGQLDGPFLEGLALRVIRASNGGLPPSCLVSTDQELLYLQWRNVDDEEK